MSSTKSGGGGLAWAFAGMFVGVCAMAMFCGLTGLYWFTSRASGTHASNPFAPEPQLRTLVDEDVMLRDDRFTTFRLHASGNAEFRVSVQREAGENHNFTAYLMADDEYERYLEVQGTLLQLGEFRHFPDFHQASAQSMYGSGRLSAGSYVFVLRESSSQNLVRAADRVRVRVLVEVFE